MILIKEKSGIYPDFSFWLVPLQLLDYLYDAPTLLWLKVKDTKSESNSQLLQVVGKLGAGCGSRSKIQNLKAIHNDGEEPVDSQVVVAQGQRYKI